MDRTTASVVATNRKEVRHGDPLHQLRNRGSVPELDREGQDSRASLGRSGDDLRDAVRPDQVQGPPRVEYKETKAGDRSLRTRERRLGSSLLVAGVVYGLVNVRTDGEEILCAVMSEKDHSWQVKTITSRF